MHLGIEAFEDLGSTPTANYHLPTTNYHLHFYTSTRPFSVTTGGTRSRASVAPMPFLVATSATLPWQDFRSQRTATLPRRPTVAEDCDPPTTRGDGALAIVSACQLPRRRGAPLLRPLARLTSFGGYVATIRYQLPTTNYQLFSINYISTLLHGHFDGEGAVATTRPFSTTARRRRYVRDALPRVRVFFDA